MKTRERDREGKNIKRKVMIYILSKLENFLRQSGNGTVDIPQTCVFIQEFKTQTFMCPSDFNKEMGSAHKQRRWALY